MESSNSTRQSCSRSAARPSAGAGDALGRGASRDPLADAPAKVAEELEMRRIENGLREGDPDPSSGLALSLTSSVDGTSQILLEDPDGSSWTLDETYLRGVVDGTETLPDDLTTELEQQGILDPVVFAKEILTLFGAAPKSPSRQHFSGWARKVR